MFALLVVILLVALVGVGLFIRMLWRGEAAWGLFGLVVLIADAVLGAVYGVLASI